MALSMLDGSRAESPSRHAKPGRQVIIIMIYSFFKAYDVCYGSYIAIDMPSAQILPLSGPCYVLGVYSG